MLLREKYKILDEKDRKVKPNFFAAKDKGKGYYDNASKNYKKHRTTMDYLQTCVNQYQRGRGGKADKLTFLPLSALVKQSPPGTQRQYYKVQRVLRLIEQMESVIRAIYSDQSISKQERCELAMRERQACIEYIGNISFTQTDMAYLLKAIEAPEYKNIYRRVIDILFGYPNTSFYSVIEESADGVYDIRRDPNGGILLYGIPYEICKRARFFTQHIDDFS